MPNVTNEYKFISVSHNISGNVDGGFGGSLAAIDDVVDQVQWLNSQDRSTDKWGPADVVMLQECTGPQRDAFAAEFPNWNYIGTKMYRDTAHNDRWVGQVIFTPHQLSGNYRVNLYDHAIGEGPNGENLLFRMANGEIYIPAIGEWITVATVHLRAGSSDEEYAARARQCQRIADHYSGAQTDKIMVGGDFNARIGKDAAIGQLYALNSDHNYSDAGGYAGWFFECDQTDPDNTCGSSHGGCREGEGTLVYAPDRKFDYIFFSNGMTYGYPEWLEGYPVGNLDYRHSHKILRGQCFIKHTSV